MGGAFFCTMVMIGALLTMAGLVHPGRHKVGELFSFREFTSLRKGRINYVTW